MCFCLFVAEQFVSLSFIMPLLLRWMNALEIYVLYNKIPTQRVAHYSTVLNARLSHYRVLAVSSTHWHYVSDVQFNVRCELFADFNFRNVRQCRVPVYFNAYNYISVTICFALLASHLLQSFSSSRFNHRI